MAQLLRHSTLMQRAIARSLGKAACIYGYPLVEVLRACRLQTTSRFELTRAGCIAMNALNHSASPPVDSGDRWAISAFARPALYTTAWICLSNGPMRLDVPAMPAGSRHRLRFALYDARSEKMFASGDDDGAHRRLLLTGPHAQEPEVLEALDGRQRVVSSTNLVWLVLHIDVDPADIDGAGQLQGQIFLGGLGETLPYKRPPAVDLWAGDASDAFVDLVERREPVDRLAPKFYANLCLALALSPPRPEDRDLVANFRRVGLMPDPSLDWHGLDRAVREGLTEAMEDASQFIHTWLRVPARHGCLDADTGRAGQEDALRSARCYAGRQLWCADVDHELDLAPDLDLALDFDVTPAQPGSVRARPRPAGAGPAGRVP